MLGAPKTVPLDSSAAPHRAVRANLAAASPQLVELSAAATDDVYPKLRSAPSGLSEADAKDRLLEIGANRVAKDEAPPLLLELWAKVWNPLNGLLMGLAVVSWLLSDVRSAVVISIMVVLSVGLSFVQEHRSNNAAAKLANMVRVRASVKRTGDQ